MSQNEPKKIKEGAFDISAPLPFFPYGQYGNDLFSTSPTYGFLDGYDQAWLSRRDNRLAGEALPEYITWFQLKLIRDEQRRICQTNEYAQAAINTFKNFCVATGFTYQVMPLRDDVPVELVQQAQELLDLWQEHNRLSEMESEICYRLHADGEAFIRMFDDMETGLQTLRFIEPELVRPPQDDSFPTSSFGIEVADYDIHQRIGYWIIERPYFNLTPTLVPADEVLHIRYNVNSNSKRGLPTTWSVQSNLRACEDLLASLSSIAKARAKFAAIRTITNGYTDVIDDLGKKTTDAVITDPLTGQNTNVSHYGYGTVLSVPDTVKWEFPALSIGSSDLIETLQVNLRAIAARFGLSEIHLSADTNNANYASSLTAESPTHKTFKRFQKLIGSYLGERRTMPERAAAWCQIDLAVKVGLLPPETKQLIKIQAIGPSVEVRDKNIEAAVNRAYFDMGVKSKQTIASEIGLNYEQERKNIDQQQEQNAETKDTEPRRDS